MSQKHDIRNTFIILVVLVAISLTIGLNRPVNKQRELYPTAQWRTKDLVLIYRMYFDPKLRKLAQEIKRNEEIYRDAD